MFEDPLITQARQINDIRWDSQLGDRLAARKQARSNGKTYVTGHTRNAK